MPKAPQRRKAPRHDPLDVQILSDKTLEQPAPLSSSSVQVPTKRRTGAGKRFPLPTPPPPVQRGDDNDVDDDDDDAPAFVDAKTSKKILGLVKEQQDEVMMEDDDDDEMRGMDMEKMKKMKKKTAAASKGRSNASSGSKIAFPPLPKVNSSFKSAADSDDEGWEDEDGAEDMDGDGWDDDGNFAGDIEIDESDAALIEKFMASGSSKRSTNLADLIMQKIDESEARNSAESHATAAPKVKGPNFAAQGDLDPKIVEVYSKVGLLLSRYRSGKLPKAFKIIPTLPNWLQILHLTNPDTWTPHATYQATRIFVSNLQAHLAQKFFEEILLEKCRVDIAETKKLNYHLYLALKKSLYKPAAFFKGLLFPLCESGTCTLREAAIIGSVITKVSIPLLHSAAAILKISEMEYAGSNSLFLRILLDKKYALPYKVIDALVFHFLRFRDERRVLPVLWHQALLVFVQRYKSDLTEEQKEALTDLIKAQPHAQISAEIRRELENSVCRGQQQDMDMEVVDEMKM